MIALVWTASHFPPIWPVCPLSTGLLITFLPSLASFFLLGCQAVRGKKEAWTRLLLSVLQDHPVPLLSLPSLAHPGPVLSTLCSSSLETSGASYISPLQLRTQWLPLPLTMPRMQWDFVETKVRRGFADTLWLKSYALIIVLGERIMAAVLGCTDDDYEPF